MAKLPQRYLDFFKRYPEVGAAYRDLSDAVQAAGPLDRRSQALVKLGVAIGARTEGGVRSHVRKCLEADITPDEIRHAVLQATTTTGFPNMMAALSWADAILEEETP
jgi:4-carboxymuconolactone decarboxylase